MIKVITPIGAVVEVDECIYEANAHILKKYEEGEEVESTVITSKEESVSETPDDTEVAPEETAPSEAQEEAVEESNTEVVIESTPEVAPENGDTEITAEVKTKATKAPKTK